MNELPWMAEAKKHIGQKEVKGPKHNSWIVSLWKAIKRGGIKDDETAWCAAYVGACFEAVNIPSTRFESARSYEKWGIPLTYPVYGAVAVLTRPGGGGHVMFVMGQDSKGNILGLGGNQGDMVNVSSFPKSRVTAIRWPSTYPLPAVTTLTTLDPVAPSRGEA